MSTWNKEAKKFKSARAALAIFTPALVLTYLFSANVEIKELPKVNRSHASLEKESQIKITRTWYESLDRKTIAKR